MNSRSAFLLSLFAFVFAACAEPTPDPYGTGGEVQRPSFTITTEASFDAANLPAYSGDHTATYAYIDDAHVRVDILRARLGRAHRAWIELLGSILFLIPYSILMVVLGSQFVIDSSTSARICSWVFTSGLANLVLSKREPAPTSSDPVVRCRRVPKRKSR